jgi:hypothetical protein
VFLARQGGGKCLCPLCPRKRTFAEQRGVSAKGQKQTFASQKAMSALPPKADINRQESSVCFVPIADKLRNRLLGVLSGRLDARTVDDCLRVQSFRHGTEGTPPVAVETCRAERVGHSGRRVSYQ